MTIFKSPYPDVEVPNVDFASFILNPKRLARCGHRAALIEGATGRELTHADVARQSTYLAAGLFQRGLRAGDVIAIFSPNDMEYAIALLGALQIGVVVTTANPTYTPDELAFQLNDSKARLLITTPEALPTAEEALKTSPLVRDVFLFGAYGAGGRAPLRTLFRYSFAPPNPVVDVNSTAVICYSSGTTGRPKGVELTHRNLVANIVCMHAQDGDFWRDDDVWLAVLPMYHVYCLVIVLFYNLYLGLANVVMPRFDLVQMLSHVQRYKISCLHIVPPIIIGLAKAPIVDKFSLASVRIIFSGAAPLGADVQEEARRRLKNVVVKQGYGMTELSPLSHVNPNDAARVRTGTIGFLIPNEEAMIVCPETGRPLGVGEEGELWVRGPNVMKGYLNNPAATADTITKDGWLRTGDIAMVDKDGYFTITDRLKELIKYKGLQVAPAELEAKLLTHPAVADAAVIPVPDPDAGELPKAFVVLKQGFEATDATKRDIATFIEGKVAPHKRLRGGVEFLPEIPKSASGKILRRVLRAREQPAKAKL